MNAGVTVLVRRLALSCSSALLAASVLAPAHAETVETPDAVGDVTVVGGGTAPEGSASGSADIVALSLKHTRNDNVNLTIRVRDLRFSPAPSTRPTARGYLRTAGGAVYRVTGMPGMSDRGYRLDRLREGREPQQVRCSVTGRQSAADDTFAFAFARSCLRNPRWLQSGAATSDARSGQELVDDARRTGNFQGGDAVRIGGPRVRPGPTSATATP